VIIRSESPDLTRIVERPQPGEEREHGFSARTGHEAILGGECGAELVEGYRLLFGAAAYRHGAVTVFLLL
jgi:hypothetical protein